MKAHLSVRQIARDLKRAHRIIQYELNLFESSNHRPYSAVLAQQQADERRDKRKKRKRKLNTDEALQKHVVSELRSGRSPDVIAGRLRTHPPPELQGKTISHESIYAWIQEGEGRRLGLHHCLCSGRPRRRKHGARKIRKTHIPERISIHERPEGINGRKELGHWETDSMIFSKQRERLSVQYERKSRYVMIHRLSNGTAEETEQALVKSIESWPQPLWKTITFDNGGEGANHARLKKTFDVKTYFCDPFASWQKGGVENANRIIRRYLPRSFNLSAINDYDLEKIQQSINQTPRRILGFLTPEEVLRGAAHC